ncbi:hypothetical protein [Kitasatospora sp. GAS204B]|uniref:hypothetical protein n=1 Tax=unclassified Kitasatospora TaxID=2633591 RepID=UPI0024757ECE|nr:hypothetical protein [Kitasatospora sp. GAS204B]MDH6117479.1 hypothetical protein [Kitasatospora sp. GAS204B]
MSSLEEPSRPLPLVTACGRRIEVGALRVAIPGRPIDRITLNVGPERGGRSKVWAGLSPTEARALAQLLLAQVAHAEHDAAG